MRKPVGWVSACRATELGCCGSHVGGIGGQECVKQNPATDLATSQQSRKNELSHRCVLDTRLFMSACTAWLGWVVAGGWWWVSLIKHPEDPTALPPTPTGWPSSAMPLPDQPTSLRPHDRFSTDPDRLDASIAITTPPIPANHHVRIRCNPGQVCRLLRFTQPGHDAVAWFNRMSLTLHT